jgi:NhaP-type Na+/H+ or K+/H+ antiporter
VIYRAFIAPRLGRPTAFEPAEPVRFAQAVGFVFAATAAVAYLGGAPVVGVVATSAALVAAFLNAAFGLCLGCEAYLLIRRVGARARVEPSPIHK